MTAKSNPLPEERERLALSQMAIRARDAHYNGDGILVNHICAIVFSNLLKKMRKDSGGLHIRRISWAVILSLYSFLFAKLKLN